jgi:sugar/nucleoside kinase (ribokinase family)
VLTGGDRIVVVGDVVTDVLVRPRGPVTPDSDTRATIVRRPGGSAANVACWLGFLGTPVSFVGRVGAVDRDFHAGHLTALGVQAHLSVDPERETGTIVVVLDDAGRRTMLTDRAANLALRADDVPPGLLERAAVLHLTGYSFFEPGVRAAALELLARARALDVPVSVDPSSVAFLRDVGPEQFLAWTAGARLCFPNRDEAAVLAGTDDPLRAAERLTASYGTVVVTLDGAGCIVADRGAPAVAVPVDRLVAVDPTGAGDAFCAGFLDAWCRGADPVAAAGAGGRVARQAVGRLGGRP